MINIKKSFRNYITVVEVLPLCRDTIVVFYSHSRQRKWNMRVTVIPIVVGALGTVPKGLEEDWKN